MENVKNWYESKALWGNIVGMLVMGLGAFGLITPEGGQIVIKELPEFAVVIIGLAANIVGFYGRVTAKHVIGKTVETSVEPKKLAGEDRIKEMIKEHLGNSDVPRG
jgi:protein-S-isoprenylcysteine O-methyltransferase Ste14